MYFGVLFPVLSNVKLPMLKIHVQHTPLEVFLIFAVDVLFFSRLTRRAEVCVSDFLHAGLGGSSVSCAEGF